MEAKHESGVIAEASPQGSSRRRKVGAVLAGGLVLGIGAAVTLASWNDSEFASSTFTAGTFTFQGSADGGTTWDDHTSSGDAASLSFVTNPANLAPEDVVYAPYSLRVTGNDATVTPVAATFSGDLSAAKVEVAVREVAGTVCDATSFAAGTDVTGTNFGVVVGSDTHLCLQAVATDALEQADTGSITWQWNAASQ